MRLNLLASIYLAVSRTPDNYSDWHQEFKGSDRVHFDIKDSFSDPDSFREALLQGLQDGYYLAGDDTVYQVSEGKATPILDHYADFDLDMKSDVITRMTHPSSMDLSQVPFYHGTKKGLESATQLSLSNWGSNFSGGVGNFVKGLYFTQNPRNAALYATDEGVILKARLNIENPLEYKEARKLMRQGLTEDDFRSQGHDAVIWRTNRGDVEEAIVLDTSIIQDWGEQ